LTAVDNTTDGPTVLPVIANGDTLTILTGNGTANPGYGDIIDASHGGRLFDVASGGSLTLQNMTLQNGQAWPWGGPAQGGAIYNQGTLVLSQVAIVNNDAGMQYLTLGDAAGGGIWSNGSLTVQNCLVMGNSAWGGDGWWGHPGGNAFGGGIYIAGGTADITGSTFAGNRAQGGPYYGSAYGGAVYVAGGTVTMSGDTLGGDYPYSPNLGGGGNIAALDPGFPAGIAYGGGLYVAGGIVSLTNDSVHNNVADYPPDAWKSGLGYGGGIFIASGATVYLDYNTSDNTGGNWAWYGPDIYGTYLDLP
jgi:hypothetical protein